MGRGTREEAQSSFVSQGRASEILTSGMPRDVQEQIGLYGFGFRQLQPID